jgi:signal transduction histidine kinase
MSEPADARATRPMDLDETIGTLVVSQEARGRRVRWTPSGERVVAQADAVAEVINILLENAARHGRSAAEITVTRTETAIEVAVHDDGPGVDHRMRGRLFDWGARGPRSSGQGIGLHIAHELMQRQGGYLEVREQGGGATFVLGLPTELPEEPPADLPEPGSLAVSADDEREERDDAAADLA